MPRNRSEIVFHRKRNFSTVTRHFVTRDCSTKATMCSCTFHVEVQDDILGRLKLRGNALATDRERTNNAVYRVIAAVDVDTCFNIMRTIVK